MHVCLGCEVPCEACLQGSGMCIGCIVISCLWLCCALVLSLLGKCLPTAAWLDAVAVPWRSACCSAAPAATWFVLGVQPPPAFSILFTPSCTLASAFSSGTRSDWVQLEKALARAHDGVSSMEDTGVWRTVNITAV